MVLACEMSNHGGGVEYDIVKNIATRTKSFFSRAP